MVKLIEVHELFLYLFFLAVPKRKRPIPWISNPRRRRRPVITRNERRRNRNIPRNISAMRALPEGSTIPIRGGKAIAATGSGKGKGIATTRKPEWSGRENGVTKKNGTIRLLLRGTIRRKAGTR